MFKINSCAKKFLKFILLISVALSSNTSFAQTFDFKNYTVNDGLPQSTVNDIKQDKNGYLWIATDGGLSKFDGKTFINYSTQNGLAETGLNSLIFDKDGTLWVGTSTGKIFLFQDEKFIQFQIAEDSLCKRILNFHLDKKGNLWAATEGLGVINIAVSLKNKHQSKYKLYYGNSSLGEIAERVLEGNDGAIWITTQNGIRKLNSTTKALEIFAPASMPHYYYTSISQAHDGRYIFGTYGNGVCLFENKTSNVFFYDVSNGLPTGLNPFAIEDKDSNLWVSSWDVGLSCITKKGILNYNVKNGLPSNKIRCMFQDFEGNIWFGTQDNGIVVYKGNKFSHYSKQNGLTDNVVNAIKKVGSKIFVGTNYGINIVENGKITNMSIQDEVGSNLITDFEQGSNNQLYVSTFNGSILVLNSLTLKKVGTLQLKENLVNALYFDKNGVLWVATNKGVSFFKDNDNLTKAPVRAAQLDDIEAVSFFNDSKNNLWIGTRRSGLIKITGSTINFLTEKNGLTHKNPTSICEDSEGVLWIGTEGGGLYSYNNNKFTHFGVENGLLTNFITTINFKDNAIWMGSNMGICKYDLKLKKFFSYTQFDGFKELEVKPQASYIDDDKIWFGTINGLATLNLTQIKQNTTAPIINLNKFEIFGKEYKYPQNLELSYRDKDITFYFTAISFTAPEKVIYQYKLIGLDNEWHTAQNNNFATYTNLVYGDYTFIIKAMNGDGVWSKETLYSFKIDAPIWRKTWFWILIGLSLILSVLFYERKRRKKLIADKENLEHQVKERTKEIHEKNSELVMKNVDISLKNKEITDSINYAKRLQDSILPSAESLSDSFKNIFVLYKPKSIVSGDFYWYTQLQNNNNEREFLIAAADCTGHGVPGAFMCMVATSLLNQIVVDNKIYEPAQVLSGLNSGVRSVLKQQETETRDGMDIALCRINTDTNLIEFAGALRPLYIFRDFTKDEKRLTDYYFEEIKPDKFPIGGLQYETVRSFENKSIKLNKGDTIYLFSDGYADQFGGKDGKKLMTKKFKEILHTIQPKSLEEQKKYLEDYIIDWCGEQEQVDDIMVIGIRM